MANLFRLFVLAVPVLALAQDPPPDDRSDELDEVVTTGMRVGQGGAQDIKFFRNEVAFARIPHPDSLTVEGLMSAAHPAHRRGARDPLPDPR